MFLLKIIFINLIILSLVYVNDSAKILGIFPNSGYSQYILGSALMKELANRGHEVTMISAYSQKETVKNLKEISTKVESNLFEIDSLFDLQSLSTFTNIMLLYTETGLDITETVLSHPNVQQLLKSEKTFDLVISELFTNEAHMGFAYHYKTPLILFSSLGAIEWSNHLVANPAPFSHVSITWSGYSDRMNFWERLRNSINGVFDLLYRHLIIFPKQNQLLKKHFPGAPNLENLMYNASIILLNSHPTMNAPVAHVPNMIEIGGFHVSPKPLPKDIKEFLDNAKHGAVFFSMGSNLRSKDLPKEKIDKILKVFSKLKQRVLWKWEDEDLSGKPANVKIGKWLPQQDILAHPNIHAFITHGGLLSTTESLYSGVPMISVPIFGDQKMNTEQAVLNGVSIKIPFSNFTGEHLAWALDEILTNSSYRESALKRSKILRDQPMKPMDKAIFWIEYVLRHQGATHLRSAALNLTWYQYLLLDVIVSVSIAIIVIAYSCKSLFSKLFCSSTKENVKLKGH